MMAVVLMRRTFLSSLRRRRFASLLSLFAIALGVALGLSVQLIHGAALDEFGRGIRQLSGDADLRVVGGREGFSDQLYVTLAQHDQVAEASPVLEIEARLPGREGNLLVYGIDIFRTVNVVPMLMPSADPDIASSGRSAILEPGRIFLSAAAQSALEVEPGESLIVQSGLHEQPLLVAGGIPGAPAGEVFAVMDIAAAQQVFDRLDRLNRIDLRLAPGVTPAVARERLAAALSPGVELLTPEASVGQAANLSRAYRVNLSMLAAIALLTGCFLVFSTQLLSVIRRRQEFAFLRAIGLERRELVQGLLAEGAMVGLIGAVAGVGLGYLLTAAAFTFTGGDLGAGYFRGVQPDLRFHPLASLAYVMLGVGAGAVGAWFPAREAARALPARSLRAGDEVEVFRARSRWGLATTCLVAAGLLCLLPPVGGVPVAGYAAVAFILACAVLALPGATRLLVRVTTTRQGPVLAKLAQARLAAAPGQAVVAGAGVVASVALAVSMAIMVSSFRGSVDEWLTQVLPADLYLRASPSVASGYLPPDAVTRVAAEPGVAAVIPVRYDSLRLSDARFPVTLVARPARGGEALPLVTPIGLPVGASPPAWISEATADLYRLKPGDALDLPIAGEARRFTVAGIWRDYARQHGAVVVELDDYRSLSGDDRTNDLGIVLAPGADADTLTRTLFAGFGEQVIQISRPSEIRKTSLAIFDRTFLVTYMMEAVAVLIGLFGIGTTFAALSVSRRKEFGMLRHLGLERRQIGRLLALEGAMTSVVSVVVGVLAGVAVALVLIEVINRQSFSWSMDFEMPFGMIAVFALSLVAVASIAARLAGAGAMRQSAVLAVREDW